MIRLSATYAAWKKEIRRNVYSKQIVVRVCVPSLNKHVCPQCRDALTTRQKLIAQDYKVSYSLAKACKADLRKYRCSLDTNMPRAREARLSYLLLCLESAVHRGQCVCVCVSHFMPCFTL